tara:strand:+ start:110 stop:226 length:117 start_codon:yes stop_codon:yes gene_type:complete
LTQFAAQAGFVTLLLEHCFDSDPHDELDDEQQAILNTA